MGSTEYNGLNGLTKKKVKFLRFYLLAMSAPFRAILTLF